MANVSIPFNVPFRTGTEDRYLQQVLQGRGYGGDGPFARRCQTFLQEYLQVPRAYLTTSCTAALEMAAMLLQLEPGDEVLVPSYTFVATASAFMRSGARPVFVEVDPDTMMMDPVDAERRVTARTRAIVPIHYAGIACEIDALAALAARHGLTLIEDAAQGYDAKIDSRWLGSIAPMATFSFHETKNLHCGLGGALIVNDERFVDMADAIWQRGTDRTRMLRGMVDKYTWIAVGSSFYPTELQAAFLLDQLEHTRRSTEERRVSWQTYRDGLQSLEKAGRLSMQRIQGERSNNYHCFYLLLPSNAERESLREYLQRQGISAYTHYVPLHSSPMGLQLGYRAEDLPRTEDLANRLLRLPVWAGLPQEQARHVVDQIHAWAAL
jgi:dTDP-4-amino-4,6-dideoxygalactose transaminase